MAKVEIVGDTRLPREEVRIAVASAVKSRLGEIDESIERLEKSLKGYEANYNVSTLEFIKKYTVGELPENLDYMEWKASKEILDDLLGERALLGEVVT